MLKLEKIKQIFPDQTISYPDWEVSEGGHALILGDSGSGKTTLLHILTGLLPPSKGNVFHHGECISKMPSSNLDAYRGRHVGIIFQKPHLVRSLSVSENIQLVGKFSGKKIHKSRVKEVMETLDISELANRRIHELSEGQAQRVSIARAVVHEPQLLAADEPTASLDDTNCEKVIALLEEQATRCKAMLLIATHDHRVKNRFQTKLEL